MQYQYHSNNEPEKEKLNEIMTELTSYIESIEELQGDLSDALECYMDKVDELYTESNLYLNELVSKNGVIRMLCKEVSAGRHEILSLQNVLRKNKITVPEEQYINRQRLLSPKLQESDCDSEPCVQDADSYYNVLLIDQFETLQEFEEKVPMTTLERQSIRNYIIVETGYKDNNPETWKKVLNDLRSGAYDEIQRLW